MRKTNVSIIAVRNGALAAILAGFFAIPTLSAQTATCDAKSMNGAFGYRLSGHVYDNFGYSYFLSAVGRMVSDGEGNLTGSETYSFDGSIVKREFTGTYTINENCTGTLTLNPASGSAFHADLVVVNNGNEVEIVQTDSGFILSGTLKKQNPVTQTTTPPPTTTTPDTPEGSTRRR